MVFHRSFAGGPTLLVDEMRDVRSLAVGFFVGSGSVSEPPGKRGMSHFLEHALFKRTRRRSAVAVARASDSLGGDVDAFTTKEYTGFYAHTLDTLFPEALELLADVVFSCAFNAEDVSTERGVILEEISEAEDNPDDLAHETFVRSFWRGHPLGAPILGTVETVCGITLEDLRRYHRRAYTPGNLVVSVAGRIRQSEVLRAVEGLRRGWAAGRMQRRSRALKLARPAARPHAILHSRPSLAQAHLCLGMEGPAAASRRRFAASLVDIVLGAGMSSRLFQEVREKRGLAYSITSSLSAYAAGGYEAVYAACAPKNLARVLDVTLAQMRRMKSSGMSRDELARAKENLKGSILLGLESTVSRMGAQARQHFTFGRVEPVEELLARVEAVTLDEAGEEAGRLLGGKALSLSVVGNVAKLPLTAADLASAL